MHGGDFTGASLLLFYSQEVRYNPIQYERPFGFCIAVAMGLVRHHSYQTFLLVHTLHIWHSMSPPSLTYTGVCICI